jgi:hypothetical protein
MKSRVMLPEGTSAHRFPNVSTIGVLFGARQAEHFLWQWHDILRQHRTIPIEGDWGE